MQNETVKLPEKNHARIITNFWSEAGLSPDNKNPEALKEKNGKLNPLKNWGRRNPNHKESQKESSILPFLS